MSQRVRRALLRIARIGRGAPARRARIVLAVQAGASDRAVAQKFGADVRTVRRIVGCVETRGIKGVFDRPRSGRPKRVTSTVREAAEELLVHRLPPNGRRWTTRALAQALRLSVGVAHELLNELGHLRQGVVRRLLRSCGVPSPRMDLAGAWCSQSEVVLIFASRLRRSRRSRMSQGAFAWFEEVLEVAGDSIWTVGRRMSTRAPPPAGRLESFVETVAARLVGRAAVVVAHSPGGRSAGGGASPFVAWLWRRSRAASKRCATG